MTPPNKFGSESAAIAVDPAPASGALANNPGVNMIIERRLRNTPVGKADPAKLFSERERSDNDALVAALEKRLLQDKLKPKQEKVLRDYLASETALNDKIILNAIRLVMSTPEYQLT